ncbi:hypothetical protein D9756_009399 [Leucocoprinus leucothites]|uniref:Uncharacterized protein n=1 Tax=Leucocoprinus leucothites TaxID=201217 RepID=A0A8H5CY37_9AGAR|nr:hypothetical protein D9756_009399 [Leucoagaricus leucothites]
MYLEKRSDVLADDTTRDRFVFAFIVMQLIGAGGLSLILFTALASKRIRRHSTWYGFTASWIFSSLCYCLLFIAGQQMGGEPNNTLCTVQAALIYAAPALTACTTLSLVIHMFLNFRSLMYTSAFEVRPITELMLLGTPYLVWAVLFVGNLAFELQNPQTVRRSPKGPIVIQSSQQFILSYRIFINRHHVLKAGMMLAMLFRVFAFSIIGIMALGLSVTFVITNDHDGAFDMLLASMPVLAMLIFGSQKDLIRVWLCQRGGYDPANTKPIDEDDDYGPLRSRVSSSS